jgi:hypothetical protein
LGSLGNTRIIGQNIESGKVWPKEKVLTPLDILEWKPKYQGKYKNVGASNNVQFKNIKQNAQNIEAQKTTSTLNIFSKWHRATCQHIGDNAKLQSTCQDHTDNVELWGKFES